jgi:pyruvate formate lyase activating enzyme
VRLNRGGKLVLPFYARISSVAVDPIEKKPLYHYHPGSRVLSVGFVGCSLRCPFCQNHRISQVTTAPTEVISPAALVDMARSEGSFAIAYTYSEPLIHLEYVLDCAVRAREAGLRNILVTNGYLEPEPLLDALPLIDAANVDLKSFEPRFYSRELGGELESVKRFIAAACGSMALEVTTLVLPGKNDSPEEIDTVSRFLATLDRSLPYHLSAYTPRYRYTAPATSEAALNSLVEVARQHLDFVYAGNLGDRGSDTVCPGCGRPWIRRRGYRTEVVGLQGDGACAGCGRASGIQGLPV